MLVSPAELAAIKGCSRASVSEAMRARIKGAIVESDGRRMLDRDLALELWDRNTRRNNNARIGAAGKARDRRPAKAPARTHPPADPPSAKAPPAQVLTTAAAAVAAEVMKLPDDAIPGLDESMERKEHYRAELAKVQALRERGEVGSIRDMEREAFALGKAVKEGVLAIIPRIGADLAAMGDRFEIEQLLEVELTTALRMLANG
jgi:hypothetical protein